MAKLPDLTTYTDTQLADLREQAQAEHERRARLAAGPIEAAGLAARYSEDGGDPADLVAAINNPPAPQSETPPA